MQEDDLMQFLVEKITEIENRLGKIEERLNHIESDWRTIKRAAWIIISIIAAKLGIDLSGIVGG